MATTIASASSSSPTTTAGAASAYSWYVATLLFLVGAFNLMDRIGAVSDWLAPHLGAASLRAALWIAAVTSIGAACAFAFGASHIRKDVIAATTPR